MAIEDTTPTDQQDQQKSMAHNVWMVLTGRTFEGTPAKNPVTFPSDFLARLAAVHVIADLLVRVKLEAPDIAARASVRESIIRRCLSYMVRTGRTEMPTIRAWKPDAAKVAATIVQHPHLATSHM